MLLILLAWKRRHPMGTVHSVVGNSRTAPRPRFKAFIPWIYKWDEISFWCLRYVIWQSWPEDRGGSNLIIHATLRPENFLWPVVGWESEGFKTWEEFASPCWYEERERATRERMWVTLKNGERPEADSQEGNRLSLLATSCWLNSANNRNKLGGGPHTSDENTVSQHPDLSSARYQRILRNCELISGRVLDP